MPMGQSSDRQYPEKEIVKESNMLAIPKAEVGMPEAATNWWSKKESAMMKARTQYELDFTDYSRKDTL